MAIFGLEAQIISRAKGRSVIAAAAYRTGKRLKDQVRNKVHDYTHRANTVLQSVILAPEGAPAWVFDTKSLWNEVNKKENRKDAQTAREILLSLPRELSTDAQFQLAVEWAKKELVGAGMVVEISHHNDANNHNPHAHVLCTLRTIEGDKFSAKKPREWNDVERLIQQRKSWAEAANAALEKAGRPERIDHRSLKDQGIDREPEPKRGVQATAMKRRGLLFDPERFQQWREVKMRNAVRPFAEALQKFGHIPQLGMGAQWWEKSARFATKARERAAEVVKGQWQKLIDSQRAKGGRDGPER